MQQDVVALPHCLAALEGPAAVLVSSRKSQRTALLQVWRTPGLIKAMSPMQLHRTYGQCHADVTSLDWSADSKWLAVGSKDLSAR